MAESEYAVEAQWDPDASVYSVTGSDVPGLVAEAPTEEALVLLLKVRIPELLELNLGMSEQDAMQASFILRTERRQSLSAA